MAKIATGEIDEAPEDDGEPLDIAPEHLPAVLEGLAQARRGEFAADAAVEATFQRFDG